jgi:hypothetical protein
MSVPANRTRCWEAAKIVWDPQTQDSNADIGKQKQRGNMESTKVFFHLKSCESIYTCREALFYRETKRLLHSEIALESKEYF